MALKQEVLQILEENRGKSVSGEEMAARLSVSRNAVWKVIRVLKAEGVEILAGTNRGYCLSEKNDLLSEEGIRKYLSVSDRRLSIELRDSVTSTNTVLKELAENGAQEGLIVIAREQSAGKGRKGRSFYSPRNGSLYMSVLLRPAIPVEQAVSITTMAAVSVARAVEETSGKHTLIKWVNDVFMDQKKICGILTEASVDMETGFPAYAVLGIGINIYPPAEGLPKELKEIVGTVFQIPGEGGGSYTNLLAAGVLNRFFEYYDRILDKSYMEEYRRRSFVIGRQVTYLSGETKRQVTVLGIDDDAGLLVEAQDGTRSVLDSGEVSIRL
ncbi:MAG: biotin--[acetyl-CoA-carboxylase] ligase [Lachnospiraceae bacterium]